MTAVPQSNSPGNWDCPRCKSTVPFAQFCNNCRCLHPPQRCNRCTFASKYNAINCEMCQYDKDNFAETKAALSSIINNEANDRNRNHNNHNNTNPPDLSQGNTSAEPIGIDCLSYDPAQLFQQSLDQHINNNKPQKQKQQQHDNDDEILDLTQVVDEFEDNDRVLNNNNNNRNESRLEASTTKISIASTITADDEQDPEMKQAMEESMKIHMSERERFKRLSSQVTDDDLPNLNIFIEAQASSSGNSGSSSESGLFGEFGDLFGSYNQPDDNNDQDTEMMGNDDQHQIKTNQRKRKRGKYENENEEDYVPSQGTDLEEIGQPSKKRQKVSASIPKKKKNKRPPSRPRRKRKQQRDESPESDIDEHIANPTHSNNHNRNHNHNRNSNSSIFHDDEKDEDEDDDIQKQNEEEVKVDIESIPKAHRTKIEKAFQKFLNQYLKGTFCLRTLCIDYGPGFKGRCKAFDTILKDTSWRPKSLQLPPNVPFQSMVNDDAMPYTASYKYYSLYTHGGVIDKRRIYTNATTEEVDKLKGLYNNGLADYFLPRMVDKNKFKYFPYVLVRLTPKEFHAIWNRRDKHYENGFDAMINEIKTKTNAERINIVMENVAQNLNHVMNQKQTNLSFQSDNDKRDDDKWKDAQHVKDMMVTHCFGDRSIHCTFTSNVKATAEFVVRSARTLAEARFNKLRVNGLSNSDHNRKGTRDGTTGKTLKDIFFSTLVTITGISDTKAAGITSQYPTTGTLIAAYANCDEEQGKRLLMNINPVGRSTKIGRAMSEKIYDIYYGNEDGDKLRA